MENLLLTSYPGPQSIPARHHESSSQAANSACSAIADGPKGYGSRLNSPQPLAQFLNHGAAKPERGGLQAADGGFEIDNSGSGGFVEDACSSCAAEAQSVAKFAPLKIIQDEQGIARPA